MRKLIFASLLVVTSCAGHAYANNYATNSPNPVQSLSTAAGSAAASGGNANATGGSATATGGNATGGNARGGKGGQGGALNVGGGGLGNVNIQNPRQVPSAYAPTMGTANPCSGSPTTMGIATPFAGGALGLGGGFDRFCQIRQYLSDPLAFSYACRKWDDEFRAAAKDAGRPCPGDAPKATPVAAPAADYTDRDMPDYCYTASAGERRQHRECRYKGG